MRILKLAVKSQRWDLVAHTIVLATARQLKNGDKRNGREKEKETRRSKR